MWKNFVPTPLRHIDMGDAFAEMDKLYSDCLMAEVMTPAKPGVEIPEDQKGGNCVRSTPPALVPHHHHRKKTELKPSIPFEPILRLCELFPFLLPAKVRREAYEPAYHDLLADFLLASRYNTKWACRWLRFCFVVRTGWMVVGSLWAMFGSVTAKCLLAFVPEQLRKYFGK